MDCNPPGSSVHGILQARILEWVAISFSRGSSWHRDQIHIYCVSCIAGGFLTTWAVGETHSPPLPCQLILNCMKLQKTLDCILVVSHKLCLRNSYNSFLTLSSIPYCRTAPSLPSQFQYQQTVRTYLNIKALLVWCSNKLYVSFFRGDTVVCALHSSNIT